eukprot:COSAG03_NODE_116_length_12390_cov_34.697258_15_plen_97_part_00
MGTLAEFAEVMELAKFPNVFMKLSGLNHFATDADNAPLYESAKPLTKRIIVSDGPNSARQIGVLRSLGRLGWSGGLAAQALWMRTWRATAQRRSQP